MRNWLQGHKQLWYVRICLHLIILISDIKTRVLELRTGYFLILHMYTFCTYHKPVLFKFVGLATCIYEMLIFISDKIQVIIVKLVS